MYEGESEHTSCTSVWVQVLTFWCTMVAWVRSVTLSLCRAALGAKRREDFLLHWREAMEIRDPMFALLASQWPGFASVRVEPGFVRILKEIGWDRPFDGAGA